MALTARMVTTDCAGAAARSVFWNARGKNRVHVDCVAEQG